MMEASAGSMLMAASREHFSVTGVSANAAQLHQRFVDGGAIYGTVFHDSIAGCTLYMRGDLEAAAAEYLRARRTAIQLHGEGSVLAAMPSSMLAELWYEHDRIDDARALIARYAPLHGELGFVDNLIAVHLTAARLAVLDGDVARAERELEDAEQAAFCYGFERMLACILDERVRLALAAGDSVRARRLLDAPRWRPWLEHPKPHAHSNTIQMIVVCAALRLVLAEGIGQDDARLLRAWFRHAADRHCERAAVRLGMLLVRTLAQREGELAARRALREVIALAARGGFVRSVVDEGHTLHALLAGLATQAAETSADEASYLRRLLAAFGRESEPADTTGTSDGADVGRRERELLALAENGLDNRDIAARLGLAESTVKWYWQRIFTKLGVHRRTQALHKARRLGLLEG